MRSPAVAAALLPAAAWIGAAIVDRPSPLALVGAPRVLAIVASDAVLIEALLLVVVAPIAGVAIASRAGNARAAMASLGTVVAFAIASSLAIGAAAWQLGALDAAVLLRSHATLAASALALGALGVFCASMFRDVLDAAAVALIVAVVAALGLLVAGPAVANVPEPAIDTGLVASPVVAIAASAGIDIIRGEVLYRLSPIAHRRFEYPAWHLASLWYLFAAGVFASGTFVSCARRRRLRSA